MMLKPLNDLCKIKLDERGTFSAKAGDTATDGILVELPDELLYYGFWSFAFEDSFMSKEKLAELLMYWRQYLGKRVYWTALSERGNILREKDGDYCYVKFTSLIAVGEADDKAENVTNEKGGSF